jgi:hypothetical protein
MASARAIASASSSHPCSKYRVAKAEMPNRVYCIRWVSSWAYKSGCDALGITEENYVAKSHGGPSATSHEE